MTEGPVGFEIDESGCDAYYVEWRPPPFRMKAGQRLRRRDGTEWVITEEEAREHNDPTWVTSYCVLDAGHEEPHADYDGKTFTDGEERGGINAETEGDKPEPRDI